MEIVVIVIGLLALGGLLSVLEARKSERGSRAQWSDGRWEREAGKRNEKKDMTRR